MTLHASKGLEFPVVFVGSLDAVPRKQFSDLDVILPGVRSLEILISWLTQEVPDEVES